jgi:nucleotide-binding universal stress UspA family protein
MTADPITRPMGVEEASETRRHPPILVTERAGDAPEPALVAAVGVARHLSAPVHVLSVVEPIGTFAADAEIAGLLADAERAEMEAAAPQVRSHVEALVGAEALARGDWTVHVATGQAPRLIAETARKVHARLVMLGIGRHAAVDRLFGSETAVRTARVTDRTLLAVAGRLQAPIRRAVVATDFSPSSLHAAREARALLEPGGVLTLVHVTARIGQTQPSWRLWTAMTENVIPGLFAEQVRALESTDGIHVEWTLRAGDTVAELLDVATRADANVVAAGRHGLRPMERLFLGSTTTALLRRSERSVLVATTG